MKVHGIGNSHAKFFPYTYEQFHYVHGALGAGDVHQRLLSVVAVVDVHAVVEERRDGRRRLLLDGQRHGRVAVDVKLDEQALLMGEFPRLVRRFSHFLSRGSMFQIWHLLVKFYCIIMKTRRKRIDQEK